MFSWTRAVLLLGLIAGTVTAGELTDPTRPPVGYGSASSEPAAARDAEAPELSFILYGDDRRRARVSGRWVEVGDRVGSARVTAIERDRVVLREGEQHIALFLGSGRPAGGKVFREQNNE